MTNIYSAGSGSEAHLWNLTPNTGADLNTYAYALSSTATLLRADLKDPSGDIWSASITGQFQYEAGQNTLGSVSGSFTHIAQFKNGMPWTTSTIDSPVDIKSFIGTSNQAAFAFERELANQGLKAFGSQLQNWADSVWGGTGNDFFTGFGDYSSPGQALLGRDWFFGDSGIDTSIYRGKFSEYSITASSSIPDYRSNNIVNLNGKVITDSNQARDGSDYLIGVERLSFSDTMLALDIAPNQTAGSVYMLYQATFNRKPDAAGLGYWINAVDKGADITKDVAAFFVTSKEFVTKYDSNPSNASYVDNLYLNVLGRPGEAGGVAYWNKALNEGSVTRAAVLEAFATLPEGASLVAADIANGIQYQQWVG